MFDGGRPPDGQPDPTRIATRRDFAAALTDLREIAGLTVRRVAKRTGIPSSTLGDYYCGRHLPVNQPDALTKIVMVCGVTDAAAIQEWQQALARLAGTPGTRHNGPAPYPGLDHFRTQDADWFFGRERLTAELVRELAGHYRGGGQLIVIGVSGSGKSSLLRAGLIPALCRGDLGVPGSQNWPWILFTPGDHPLMELATELAAKTRTTPAHVEGKLRSDPRAAADFARRACGAADAGDTPPGSAAPSPGSGSRLVVVVDQFEEVFTSCSDEAERSAFIAALGAVADGGPAEPADTVPDERCPPAALVVLGLRADFYSQALRRRDLLPAIRGGQVVVEPMAEDELRDVIVKPARKAGVDLEDGLVELLLRDLRPAGEPGSHRERDEREQDEQIGGTVPATHEACTLPLLSHVLRLIWERRQRGRMTVAGYKASGRIWDAVAGSAEKAYGDLTDTQQEAAQRLFLRLVRIGDDTADTRRRVRREELLDSPGHLSGEWEAVLKKFVDQRLIVEDRDQVAIAHDSLLSAWPRLHDWIRTDREGRLVAQRLTDDAHAWEAEGRDSGRLYRGGQLAIADDWARGTRRGRQPTADD